MPAELDPSLRPQYTPAFLAASFALALAQARSIIAASDGDRLRAAEIARHTALRRGG